MQQGATQLKLSYYDRLKLAISNKTAKVLVIGLGYVGSSIARAIASTGFEVTGYDISTTKMKEIQSLKYKNLTTISDIDEIKDYQIIIICVPIPVKQSILPDFSLIEQAIDSLSKRVLKEGQLLLIESTLQPGGTREFILPLVLSKKPNFKVGENFFLGYSPERVDPGNKDYSSVGEIPKIVSGITENCLLLTEVFYSQFIKKIHRTSSTEIAEFAKLFENTYRAVNIAFVDEIAIIANKMNINTLEILEAAYTKPFGIMPFWPTVGVGGTCISADPILLNSWANTNNCYSKFVEIALHISQQKPNYLIQRIIKILNEEAKSLTNSKILLIGMTYKPNFPDLRLSSSVKLAKLLSESGVDLYIYDPYVKELDINCKPIKNLNEELLKEVDLVIFSVAHDCLNTDLIFRNSKKIFHCAGKPVFPKDKKVISL